MTTSETLAETLAAPTRSQRLKAATRATHDRLDQAVMAGNPFASRDRFARFLRVQYRFHRDLDALYAHPLLAARLPDLGERRRLLKIANDLGALGQAPPAPAPARLRKDTPLPTALGWLYVAEGSNVGGTVLYKIAVDKLGLDRHHGASHLAAHPDGAARHWREFTAALDTVPLSTQQEDEVVHAAEDAFRTVHAYVREEFA